MTTINRVTLRSAIRLLGAVSAATLLAVGATIRPTLEAQATSNPIVTENALAGSPQTEWDIQGSGDPTLQGFATDISVNKGSVVSFKIKTSAPGFVIEIYRLGYYQGFGARKIATVTPTIPQVADAQNQPACLSEAASGLVDCGNWKVTGSWNTTGVTSGIFIAKLSRSDNLNLSSHIYFIVRDDSRRSDLLFQTSDTTWQAYNQYGGNSLYCGGPFSNSAGQYSCPTRSAKVSYNRPFDTRVLNPQSFLFNAEYPMVRWLEANGYDVKYWSGVDTDRFGVDPTIGLISANRPKAFFSVGHDEYWSAAQRAHVESARNAGVNLAFFSGNEMFWKTRYESSIDGSNTGFRTLVSYKETFGAGNRVDPDSTQAWTGTWRDPRFPQAGGGNPENALTGQLWTVNCCSDRVHVPASVANLRFWRNTPVASLVPSDPIGYRLSDLSLGYEWDEVIDNGLLPPGLVRLSITTLVVPERVTDFGINVAQGTATHSLTLYRHSSGALVFGAGTVQWSWGLDAVHDRSQVGANQAAQQATVNLLADMGVQPDTLGVGADPTRPLVTAAMSTDTQAPTSAVVSPAAGSSVESGSRVAISGTAIENGGGTLAGVEISVDNGATWHRASVLPSGLWNYEWTPGSLGTANIRSRAFDDSGNVESVGPGTNVNVTPGPCPCTSLWRPNAVPTVSTASDNNSVEVGTKFFSDIDGFITGVRFYKSTPNTGTHIGNLWSLTGTRLATVTFANETPSGWQQATFSSPVPVSANTTYVISYHTDVGFYSADGAYFATDPIESPPLHAPSDPVAGGNGVFAYGASQFPNNTFNGTNYWVDVVFASTVTDATPPVISRIKATLVDSSRVTITWTTNEESTSKILYSTDPELLSDTTSTPAGTQTINVGTFVTQHSVLLSGLTPNTTYFYRVISVDRSGNAANVPAPSVTVPGPTLRDTTTPDFSAGAGSSTYVSETTDGEVILQPSAGSEFSGSTLPPGWLNVSFGAGGAAYMGDGGVLVDGSRLGTCVVVNGSCQEQWSLTPGHRLEFIATFTGEAFQHSGFAQDFTTATQPWAIFSTMGGTVLAARTNTGASSVDTVLGPGFLGLPHRYTIDWNDTSVVYTIDGVVVATHNVAVAGPMRPMAASDFSVFGGNVVVDWIRLTPYAASGIFQSRVFDANALVDWNTIQWRADAPSGTGVAISVRTGSTPTADDGTWSGWQPVAAPGSFALSSRYIQYSATLSTANTGATPQLEDIIISTGHAPVAVPDSIVVPPNGTVTLPASGTGSLVANDTDADNNPLEVSAVRAAVHGTVELNVDGSVKYTPNGNYSGPDSFLYTVSDGLLTSSALVTVDVRVANSPPPGISISDVTLAEGNSGNKAFTFTVSLAGASDVPVSVSFATADSTATAPGDYTPAAGTLTFAPGVVSLPVSIGVSGDTLNEDDEAFSVNLFNAVNGTIKKTQGAGVIQNDDAIPTLTIGNATVAEGNIGSTNMTFTVTLSALSGKTVTVNYATANGSALAPSDYTAQSGTLTFSAGTATQAINVPLIGNTVDTPNKTFTVSLSSAVNATIAAAQATGTIVDDDTSLVTDSSTVDFTAGTGDGGIYFSETGNGEVMLKPNPATEFSGTTLPTGWVSSAVATKGSAVVSNGTIKLQGVRIQSTLGFAGLGHSMEFAATLDGQADQFVGTLLAQFTAKTVGTTVSLYAKTTIPGKIVETPVTGSWFGTPHRFRIDWTSAGVTYWIDGSMVANHNVVFAAATKMIMVANDVSKGGGVLTLDYMRATPYALAGTYTSKVFDAGAPVSWLTMSWTADKPAGTNIVVSYRTGNTPTPDGTWTAFATIPASGGALAGFSRYIQYKLQESTTNDGQTPAMNDLIIAFNR